MQASKAFTRRPLPAWYVTAGMALVLVVGPARAQSSGKFAPACSLPFHAIAETHPIDRTCGFEGRTKGLATQEQNRAKNHLCAVGDPIPISLDDLTALQRAVEAADIPFGRPTRLPPDRAVLADLVRARNGSRLGEGSVVEFVGFLLEAHVADRIKGESVNCNQSGEESNDLHLTFAATQDAQPCDGFVGEMIPHFRPATWTAGNLNGLRGRPLRVRGQLLFDAGHLPCRQGRATGSNPARISLWEIHPIYAVDICTTTNLDRCQAGDVSAWTPLHAWAGRIPRGL